MIYSLISKNNGGLLSTTTIGDTLEKTIDLCKDK